MSHVPNSTPLWVAIEPKPNEIRLELFRPSRGSALRARLPATPAQERALLTLLEALSLWYGRPLHAVLDVAATDVQAHPERWAAMLGDARDEHVVVEWLALPDPSRRDRFLGALGRSRRAERLASFAGALLPGAAWCSLGRPWRRSSQELPGMALPRQAQQGTRCGLAPVGRPDSGSGYGRSQAPVALIGGPG
jgi:hypothetical protein